MQRHADGLADTADTVDLRDTADDVLREDVGLLRLLRLGVIVLEGEQERRVRIGAERLPVRRQVDEPVLLDEGVVLVVQCLPRRRGVTPCGLIVDARPDAITQTQMSLDALTPLGVHLLFDQRALVTHPQLAVLDCETAVLHVTRRGRRLRSKPFLWRRLLLHDVGGYAFHRRLESRVVVVRHGDIGVAV